MLPPVPPGMVRRAARLALGCKAESERFSVSKIERFTVRANTGIKEFRAVAARYDETDEGFGAGFHLVAGVTAAT